jgi:hypothetical protein
MELARMSTVDEEAHTEGYVGKSSEELALPWN